MWTEKEQTVHRELWAKALMEQEFLPGQRALRGYGPDENLNDRCRCILGVACEMYQQATGDGRWVPIAELQEDIESTAGAAAEFTMPKAGDSPYQPRYVPWVFVIDGPESESAGTTLPSRLLAFYGIDPQDADELAGHNDDAVLDGSYNAEFFSKQLLGYEYHKNGFREDA